MNFNKIAILGCSDGNTKEYSSLIESMLSFLKENGINYEVYTSCFADENEKTKAPQIRAKDLMSAFEDKETTAIFDVTGGDSANQVLSFLDFNKIKENKKPYFGYSDNSSIINPLVQIAGCEAFYIQTKFMAKLKENKLRYIDFFKGNTKELLSFPYEFIQGNYIKGTGIAGGNVRCTLKLFGTSFQPDFKDKILFLEAYGGNLQKIETMLYQYKQSGAFEACAGILLGNFSEISQKGQLNELYESFLKIIDNKEIPIAVTKYLGHDINARALDFSLKQL